MAGFQVKGLVAVAFLASALIVSGAEACLTLEQLNALSKVETESNITNGTLISIFSMLCNNATALDSKINAVNSTIPNYYTKNEIDLINNATRDYVLYKLEWASELNDTMQDTLNQHMANYTSWVDEQTDIASAIMSVGDVVNKSLSIDSIKRELEGKFDSKISEMPFRYVTVDDFNSWQTNFTMMVDNRIYALKPNPGEVNWMYIAIVVAVLGIASIYLVPRYLEKRKDMKMAMESPDRGRMKEDGFVSPYQHGLGGKKGFDERLYLQEEAKKSKARQQEAAKRKSNIKRRLNELKSERKSTRG